MAFPRRHVETYSPGRKDARTGEAQAFLASAVHLRNMTANGLACQFNLKAETAEQLLKYEAARRG